MGYYNKDFNIEEIGNKKYDQVNERRKYENSQETQPGPVREVIETIIYIGVAIFVIYIGWAIMSVAVEGGMSFGSILLIGLGLIVALYGIVMLNQLFVANNNESNERSGDSEKTS